MPSKKTRLVKIRDVDTPNAEWGNEVSDQNMYGNGKSGRGMPRLYISIISGETLLNTRILCLEFPCFPLLDDVLAVVAIATADSNS